MFSFSTFKCDFDDFDDFEIFDDFDEFLDFRGSLEAATSLGLYKQFYSLVFFLLIFDYYFFSFAVFESHGPTPTYYGTSS